METGKNREASAAGCRSGIKLTDSEKSRFQQLYQEGICRELHRRGLLTEDQLNTLLNRRSDSCRDDRERRSCDNQRKAVCSVQEKSVCSDRGRAVLWTECREEN